MLDNIKVFRHNSIKFLNEKIYFDPFKIEDEEKDANIIFVTHSHYDHFSEEDIMKIKNENTKIVVTTDLEERCLNLGFKDENIIVVTPNEKHQINEIKFETVKAYNINKKFHPKENNWVGYVVEINNKKYYIAGDTDITEENKKVKCDVAFVPVGGTYTMNSKEAAEFINEIKPRVAVPIHYGEVVGEKQDAIDFVNRVSKDIKCEILIK